MLSGRRDGIFGSLRQNEVRNRRRPEIGVGVSHSLQKNRWPRGSNLANPGADAIDDARENQFPDCDNCDPGQ
jgi:hypothetical protein